MLKETFYINKPKQQKNPDIIREYKNKKNEANSLISKEKYLRKIKKFKNDENTPKEKWKKTQK